MKYTIDKQLIVVLTLGGSDTYDPSCIVVENKQLKRVAVINVKWLDVGTVHERVDAQVIKEYHASEVASYHYESSHKISF